MAIWWITPPSLVARPPYVPSQACPSPHQRDTTREEVLALSTFSTDSSVQLCPFSHKTLCGLEI